MENLLAAVVKLEEEPQQDRQPDHHGPPGTQPPVGKRLARRRAAGPGQRVLEAEGQFDRSAPTE